MKLRLSEADKKLLEFASDPALLDGTTGAKNVKDIVDGVILKATVFQDITNRGKYTGAPGFDPDGHFQHVASIPQSVISALVLIDPEILIRREKFYGWLRGPGKVWDVRRKTVKGAM